MCVKFFFSFIKKHFGVAFDHIDLDGDGLINYDEFCKWYELRCANHTTTKVRDLWQQCQLSFFPN